jgi:hypothetical protein
LSPRIHGVKERRTKIFYDTILIEPGQTADCFGAPRIGTKLTNLQVPGQFGHNDGPFILLAFGVRVLDTLDDEAARALDHIHLVFEVGARPMLDFYGPQAIMTAEIPNGFKLPRPIVIPERQNFRLRAEADPGLSKAYGLRFHLGGLQTRDVP